MLLSALLAAVSQVLLKISANRPHKNRISEYLNVWVITGYGLLVLTLLMNTWAYRGVEYKIGPILNSASYVFVMLLGRLVLKEKITKRKAVGVSVIVLGIVISTVF